MKQITIMLKNEKSLASAPLPDDVANTVWADICYGGPDDTIIIPCGGEDQMYVNKNFLMFAQITESEKE